MHFLSFTWNADDVLFQIGPIAIHYYSLMFVIAFSLGYYIMKKIYNNEKVPLEYLDTLFIYVVVATLLGARLGEVFFYSWDYYKDHMVEILLPIREAPGKSIFGFIEGYEFTGFRGLASHGAAIGIIVGMFLYRRKYQYKSIMWILDRVVIPVACGAIFVRLGNFFNSEIVGKPTNSNFGVIFEKLGEDFPRHPAQLYESFGYIFVFSILYYLYWKTDKKDKPGYLFGTFLVLLWTVRFFVEFVKESQGGFESSLGNILSTGQWLSIPFIALGIFMMMRANKKIV
ncbi:prolipoprotein diacylglyceryl transferase [Zhouia amylolytica]|uniref:Phosphatidylglycerol--prolipoprotein diacylglyceryl transferase n=1 Tax=Zhouia amylolytica TaxID=376730 RepID=A0A1I6RKJ9_9FLAO|nr:prolipoprotein diacylglyceryl transferase [Zhouia amylolytica]MCQ0110555.1 prolipoprotein diacylglyceryl transferase [Zhouia amylolytica]SFS65174.1 prolipoprotein diacylglyceryl transferase [Zhouia amylolytica]